MNKFTQLLPFIQNLFDNQKDTGKAARIVEATLKVRSPRLSEISRAMEGDESAGYKMFSVSGKPMIREKYYSP